MEQFRQFAVNFGQSAKDLWLSKPMGTWFDIGSFALMSLSYFFIFFLVVFFATRRPDIKNRHILWMLGLALLGSAALSGFRVYEVISKGVSVYNNWEFRSVLAVLWFCTAIFLRNVMPKALQIPNPSEVKETIYHMEGQLENYKVLEDQLRQAQDNLEKVVEQRTAELRDANQILKRQNDERLQIEKALRESEEYFRALIENALDITAILDQNGRVLYQSPSVQRLLGYQTSELTGKSAFDFIHPDDASKMKLAFSKGLNKPENRRLFELRFRHRDGSWRILEATGKNLLLEPAIHGVIINARDITDRRRAEKEIRFLPTIMHAIAQSDDFLTALQTALCQVTELTGWSYGEVWIPRQDEKYLELCPVWYGDEKFKDFWESGRELKILPDSELPGRVWTRKEAHWIPDITNSSTNGLARIQAARALGIKAGFGVPILVGGQALAIVVFYLLERRSADERYLPLVTTVAAQLGVVLQRKKAQEDLWVAHRELEKKIQERTMELAASNASLKKQMEERRSIEDALKESEQRSQSLVSSVEGIVWELDLATARLSFVSQKAESLLGYPINYWFSQPTFWQDHVHGEDRETAMAFRQKVAQGILPGAPENESQYRMISASGKSVWFRDMVSPVIENGKITRLRGTMIDITEQKNAQMAWQDERNFVTAVVDTASALVIILDTQGKIERMNRACEKLCGYNLNEVEGRPFWEVLLVPEEVERVKTVFTRLLAGQYPSTFESYVVAKGGSKIIVAWSNTVLKNKDKATTHIIVTGIDITNRKVTETKLQQAVEDLARSNERLEKFSSELKDANQRLKKLDELKSRFISVASHELKTPLTSLKGYVEMVLNEEAGAINPEQKEYLGYVKESTDRLHRLLKELLDISKIESGQVKMKSELTDLRTLLREETALFKIQAQEKNITLVPDIEHTLTPVSCDPDKIREVFDNLLSNAIKYTPQGRIEVHARNLEDGVEISVQDTGIGIKKEDLPRIFEPFQHIEKAGLVNVEDSTGLGLALVKKIVEAHGGEIKAESSLGKGSIFTVKLTHSMHPKTNLVELIGQDL